MILVLVLFYMCCWSPYWIATFLSVYGVVLPSQATALKILYNVIHVLPYMNCALNPFLYGFLTENFKEVFRQNAVVRKLTGTQQLAVSNECPEAILVAPTHRQNEIELKFSPYRGDTML